MFTELELDTNLSKWHQPQIFEDDGDKLASYNILNCVMKYFRKCPMHIDLLKISSIRLGVPLINVVLIRRSTQGYFVYFYSFPFSCFDNMFFGATNNC